MNFNEAVNIIRNYAVVELGVQNSKLPEVIEAIQDNFDDVRDDDIAVVVAYRAVMRDLGALFG